MEENKLFDSVHIVGEIKGDREKSILKMRQNMFKENDFMAAVFIGGMKGIVDEFRLFRQFHPGAKVIPVFSTGGAVLDLRDEIESAEKDLFENLDYISLFYRHLAISPGEERRISSQQ